MKDKIQDLLKMAEEEQKKTFIPPRKFKSTKDGKIMLDPNKPFDKDRYENDRAYDMASLCIEKKEHKGKMPPIKLWG